MGFLMSFYIDSSFDALNKAAIFVVHSNSF